MTFAWSNEFRDATTLSNLLNSVMEMGPDDRTYMYMYGISLNFESEVHARNINDQCRV